jgi:hypothetical protein
MPKGCWGIPPISVRPHMNSKKWNHAHRRRLGLLAGEISDCGPRRGLGNRGKEQTRYDAGSQLECQKTAVERALAALREVHGSEAHAEPASRNVVPKQAASVEPVTPEAPTDKRRKFSAAARRKMAKIKGEIDPPSPSAPEPPKPKRKIGAEGRKRIIAATRKRWRLQRAAAKSVPAKKVSP